MASEREEMIGFLLSRLDTRDKLIAQLHQQIEAGRQALDLRAQQQIESQRSSKTVTEHPSRMANKAAR